MYRSLDGSYYPTKEITEHYDQIYKKNYMDKQNELIRQQNMLIEEQNKLAKEQQKESSNTTSSSSSGGIYIPPSYFSYKYTDEMSYDNLIKKNITTELYEYYLQRQKAELDLGIRSNYWRIIGFIIITISIICCICIKSMDLFFKVFILGIPVVIDLALILNYFEQISYNKNNSIIYNKLVQELNRYKNEVRQQKLEKQKEEEQERKRNKARMDSMVKNGFRNVTSTDRNLNLDTNLFNK